MPKFYQSLRILVVLCFGGLALLTLSVPAYMYHAGRLNMDAIFLSGMMVIITLALGGGLFTLFTSEGEAEQATADITRKRGW